MPKARKPKRTAKKKGASKTRSYGTKSPVNTVLRPKRKRAY